MAKQRRPEPAQPASSRTTIAILAIGGLLVAALVVWALTRTVEPQATVADTAATTTFSSTPPTTAPSVPLSTTQTTTMPPFPSSEHVQTPDKAAVPRIAVEDLREKMKTNAVTVIDVRDDASFAAGHIPGSLHIPFARVEGEMSALPKGKPIVTYCTWPAEESSAGAALILKHGGYDVSALYGGFNTWKQMGYPVSTGAAQ